MYTVLLSITAKKELKEISKRHRDAIISALEDLQQNPFVGKPLRRELTGRFSYKVGVYRIIYKINKKDKVVQVLTAGHRSSVYK